MEREEAAGGKVGQLLEGPETREKPGLKAVPKAIPEQQAVLLG